ncbi:hypothetical protein ACRQEF_05870 [Actinotignum sp. GS-2025a]
MSALEVVGFPADTTELKKCLGLSTMKMLVGDPYYEFLVIHDDPSNVCVGFFKTADGFFAETMALLGSAGHVVSAFQLAPGLALVDVYDPAFLDDPGIFDDPDCNEEDADKWLLTRLLVCVDDPHMYPIHHSVRYAYSTGDLAHYTNYHLAAIGVAVEVFPNLEEWEKAKESIGDDSFTFGPKLIMSPDLFDLYEGECEPDEASPSALFAAVCENVEIVTNSRTGKKWYSIDADCGFPIKLALPIDIEPAPQPGSIVDGGVLLTGSTGAVREDYEEELDD